MAFESRTFVWRAAGRSVTGASHLRSDRPNQDALGWRPDDGTGLVLVAVSDGHGSAKCFRSEIGAGIAVRVMLDVLQEMLDTAAELGSPSRVKRAAEERLPQEIVRRWDAEVARHVEEFPFTDDEHEVIERTESKGVWDRIVALPEIAYGATVLAAAATASYLLFVQLGDGDLLAVSDAGDVIRAIPKDERLFANETTSLCSPHSWQDVRIGFQALSGAPPALILLSTDGYSNSFRDDAGFLRVGADLLELIQSDGLDPVVDHLETWLAEASSSGSGDDVTVGLIYRDRCPCLPATHSDEEPSPIPPVSTSLEDDLPHPPVSNSLEDDLPHPPAPSTSTSTSRGEGENPI